MGYDIKTSQESACTFGILSKVECNFSNLEIS